MTEAHIKFERLSELHDEEITISEERESVLDHIDECPFCKTEFEQLRSSIMLCNGLKQYMVCDSSFSATVMGTIKWRSRRRTFMRYLPAVAASFVLVGGVALISSAVFESDVQHIAVAEPIVSSTNYNETGMENIVSILSANKASILNMSDMFIEGEILATNFPKLRRDLAYKKLFFSAGPQARPSAKVFPSDWNPLVEEVGASNFQKDYDNGADMSYSSQEYVRFKVFK